MLHMSISVICPPAANDPRLLFKKKKKKTTPVICLIALAFIASPVAFADHGVPLSHVTHTPLCVCAASALLPELAPATRRGPECSGRNLPRASSGQWAEVAAGPREHSGAHARFMRIQRDAGRAGQARVAALGAFRCAGRPDALHAVAFSFTTQFRWRPLPPPGRRQR
jgi:hypothetical protein